MQAVTKPTLIYFAGRGIVEPIRLLLNECDVDYDDVYFTRETLADKKKDLLFGQLPVWQEPQGFTLVQSNSILRYLAKKHGLISSDAHEAAQQDSINEFFIDNRQKMGFAAFGDSNKKDELCKEYVTVYVPTVVVPKIESILEKSGTGYLVGSKLSFVDLVWFCYFEWAVEYGLDLSNAPHIKKFVESVQARPNITKYISSSRRLPNATMLPRFDAFKN